MSQEEQLFATFMLDHLEFALDVNFLRDAIPAPRHIVALPASPEHVMGIIELRDKVIPIIDTRKRFRMTSGSGAAIPHVAITACRGRLFGLLFDHIREVIRVRQTAIEQLAPEFQREGGLLSGIIKLEDGRRLVQIINPLAMFDDSDWQGGAPADDASNIQADQGQGAWLQVVSFESGGQPFGIPVENVREIITVPAMTQRVLVEDYIRGVISLRDEFISVLDLRRFLAGSDTVVTPDSRIMILWHQGVCFGLLVDGIREVIRFREREKLSMPPWSGHRHQNAFVGVLERRGTSVVLIDMVPLFAEAIERLSSHLELHQGKPADSRMLDVRQGGARRGLYITFALNEVYGVGIEHLREIVPCQGNIKAIPGQRDFVQGLLTLRSEVIPVINLRRFLGRPPGEGEQETLIMIFTHQERLLGILIDRLLEIKEISLDKEEAVPALLARKVTGAIGELVERVIETRDRDGSRIPVMVLNIDRLMSAMAREG